MFYLICASYLEIKWTQQLMHTVELVKVVFHLIFRNKWGTKLNNLRSNAVTNPPSPNILTINYSADCVSWDKVSPLRVHVDIIFLHAEMYCVTFFWLGTKPWLLACNCVKREEIPCKTGLRWGTWSCLSKRHTRQKSSLL